MHLFKNIFNKPKEVYFPIVKEFYDNSSFDGMTSRISFLARCPFLIAEDAKNIIQKSKKFAKITSFKNLIIDNSFELIALIGISYNIYNLALKRFSNKKNISLINTSIKQTNNFLYPSLGITAVAILCFSLYKVFVSSESRPPESRPPRNLLEITDERRQMLIKQHNALRKKMKKIVEEKRNFTLL